MIRMFTDSYVPKYTAGKWQWNEAEERIEFEPVSEAMMVQDEYMKTCGFNFLVKFNQLEEMIFRQEFQRPDTTHDANVILIQDIKSLVLFLAPSEIITSDFINFVHTKTVDRFIHALLIYFEHFLKMVEFVLIRRDEIHGDDALLQNDDSTEIKRIFSAYLSQYRLLLAREYSEILIGNGDMKPFYHITPIVNISQSIKDQAFHESFLAFCTQIVWIAMHRRAYEVIDTEMCRLFRSEHFKLTRNESVKFTTVEQNMLYGKNYRRVNYRAQNSPLIQELANVADENLPILWIGERKYRGTDLRIYQLELEFIVPGSQLPLIDMTHGILGHPKKLYNTMLEINWEAVRFQDYTQDYDPYRIMRQPYLEIPNIDAEKLRRDCQKFESYYHIVSYHEEIAPEMRRKWVKRDQIVNYFKTEGMLTDVWMLCGKEVTSKSYGPSVGTIIKRFLKQKEMLRKK